VRSAIRSAWRGRHGGVVWVEVRPGGFGDAGAGCDKGRVGRCRECVPESTALARRGVPRARRSGCAAVLVDQPAEYVDPFNAPD
jgi:hypothetical protein